MTERLPIAMVILLIGLMCFILSKRPALSKDDMKELKKLDSIISKTFGGN